jgi:hypothetical protein
LRGLVIQIINLPWVVGVLKPLTPWRQRIETRDSYVASDIRLHFQAYGQEPSKEGSECLHVIQEIPLVLDIGVPWLETD